MNKPRMTMNRIELMLIEAGFKYSRRSNGYQIVVDEAREIVCKVVMIGTVAKVVTGTWEAACWTVDDVINELLLQGSPI